jgi:hypothetical protein
VQVVLCDVGIRSHEASCVERIVRVEALRCATMRLRLLMLLYHPESKVRFTKAGGELQRTLP